jgi:putative flippase GtrA
MQLIKYLVSGGINTLVGYGVFLALLTYLGWSPELANAAGYGVALVVAYILNKTFVFKGSAPARKAVLRFLVAFALAFSTNQLVLIGLVRVLDFRPELAQVIAMGVYTVAFYLLNKNYVFKDKKLCTD